jgi:hypothetical protein
VGSTPPPQAGRATAGGAPEGFGALRARLAVSDPAATRAAPPAPGSVPKQWASGDRDGLLLVVLQTLGFTAAHDAFAFECAALTGDRRVLPFSLFTPPPRPYER